MFKINFTISDFLINKQIFIIALILISQCTICQTVRISGSVYEYVLRTPIPNAAIKVNKLVKAYVNGASLNQKNEYKNLLADENGKYEIDLPKGEYVIEITALNHIKRSKYINLVKDMILDFEVSETNNQLDEVEVTARKSDDNIKSTQSSIINLNIQNIKKMPIVFGESDIIKALTLQPGVTTVGEGAGGFNVRGGKVDQNLVLLDDAPLFNTSHLLGLFTSINTEAIQNASLYKAGMPARYGGRLSSLLNIITKTNITTTKRAIGIGPISSNAFLQLPFSKGKGSFLMASRGAYPNLLLKALPKRFKGSKASFFDLNTTLQYQLNNNNSLKFTGYHTKDAFKFPEDTSYFWGSTAATAQWSLLLSKRLSVNTKGILSHYSYGVLGLGNNYEFELSSKVRHHEGRIDALFDLEKYKIEFGANLISYNFSPGTIKPNAEGSSVNSQKLNDTNAHELAMYLSNDWTITKGLSAQLGVRYVTFENISGGTLYQYLPNAPRTLETIADTLFLVKGQKSASYGGFEPRFSFKIELNSNSAIKGSYNKTRQFIHLISNTTAISPVDYWQLSNKCLKPQLSDQFSLGFYKNIDDNKFESYIEGFYKNMDQIVEYKDGANLLLNSNLETELLTGKGFAYGIELSVIKNKGQFTGSFSYTFSRSLIKVNTAYPSETINNGQYYPSLYDKPHNLNVMGQYFLGRGWVMASTFVYQTGRPITYPDGQYNFNGQLLLNYSKRNADRLPDFHRMDISFSKDSRSSKDQKKYHNINISFYNIYARKNPYSIYFKQFLETSKSYRLSILGVIVPSITITKYW
jgi:TonB-dependent Receptor Plug Domain